MLTDQPGNESWPITGSTFILMYKVQEHPDNAKTALQFFDGALTNGQPPAESLDYVPMPANVVRLIERTWKQVRGMNDTPIWATN